MKKNKKRNRMDIKRDLRNLIDDLNLEFRKAETIEMKLVLRSRILELESKLLELELS